VSVQYRVVVAKGDERTSGPADADVVVTVPLDVVTAADFDPVVAYMQGRLKSTGPTGELLEVLRSGAAAEAISPLASHP